MNDEFKIIFETYESEISEIEKIFYRKSVNYGKNNIKDEDTNTSEALDALFFRMKDKLNRFKQLNTLNIDDEESIVDTLRDLANYSLIASIVSQKKWK